MPRPFVVKEVGSALKSWSKQSMIVLLPLSTAKWMAWFPPLGSL